MMHVSNSLHRFWFLSLAHIFFIEEATTGMPQCRPFLSTPVCVCLRRHFLKLNAFAKNILFRFLHGPFVALDVLILYPYLSHIHDI